MQAEHKHKALEKSSQARTDSEASKQYSGSFRLISFKSQQIMSTTTDMLEPETRTLLLTLKHYTLWAFWMQGRLLMKGTAASEVDTRITHGKLGNHSSREIRADLQYIWDFNIDLSVNVSIQESSNKIFVMELHPQIHIISARSKCRHEVLSYCSEHPRTTILVLHLAIFQ